MITLTGFADDVTFDHGEQIEMLTRSASGM
jgi:hypothetical protein